MRRLPYAVLIAAAASLAAGCGDQLIGPGGTRSIQVLDNQFSPSFVQIARGTTVRWTNNGSNVHNIVADNGGWSHEGLASGESYSRIFTQPGTVTYRCTIHANMAGTIDVE